MYGAIIGDIVGSRFEWSEFKSKDFVLFSERNRFTDDTLMTLAIGLAFVLNQGKWFDPSFQNEVVRSMVRIGRQYPRASWGANFYMWLFRDQTPYFSYGNGAAMRVSSVGWVADSEEEVKYLSRIVTEVSHDHPEGLKGGESVAMAIYLARTGADRETIRQRMITYYPRIRDMKVDNIRNSYGIDSAGKFISCQGSVPEAIVCFLESDSFEDTIRNAVSLGGDSDTQAAIAGSIAEAFYGIPDEMIEKMKTYLPENLQSICYAFQTVKKERIKV